MLSTQVLIFAGMFMGFGIKVPMFPFHTWLPDAHTQAPTVGSVILAAVLLKLGTYGFIRVALPILPEAAVEWAPWIGLLAVIGIIYGALGCLAQTDMKRLIAFSSVAHMGFVMLGIASLTDFGLNAAVFGMVAHGLITGMLFFLAGSVKERFHTLEIKRLGGLLLQAPKMGWILGFCVMASLGLPGLAGFWGEFPAILSAYNPGAGLPEETFRTYMVIAAVGTVFAAGYLLWLFQRTSFGTPTGGVRRGARPRRPRLRVDRVAADAHPDPRARHLSRTSSSRSPTRCSPRWARPSRRWAPSSCSPPSSSRRSTALRSTSTRSRRSSSSPARSWSCCWPTSSRPSGSRGIVPQLAGIGILARWCRCSRWPLDGDDRVMFGGAYVVDNFALVLKVLFLVGAYVVVLLSTNYIAEGDYAEGEYYFLLLSSLLGMTVMASPRPHHDLRGARAAVDPRLHARRLAQARPPRQRGRREVLPDGRVRLGGDALRHVAAVRRVGQHAPRRHRRVDRRCPTPRPFITLGVVLVVIGFAFKVSAVPFHTWAPDTYEGAPTPITAFLAVLSKTAGFVALLQLILIAFAARSDVIEPLMWGLSALTMTVGNLIALRQTNIVRMLAYSGVAQAGFMLAPLAVVGSNPVGAGQAVITYLLIYAAMNLGAFAVVLAVARKTRSAEISTWGGLFEYAPGLTVLMTMFLFSLAGIPPLGGWLAKFVVFRALLEPDVTAGGVTLAVVVGVNSVIALYYYANVAKTMWMDPVPDGDRAPVRVPFSLGAALAISITLTVAFGVSNLATRFGDLALFVPHVAATAAGPPAGRRCRAARSGAIEPRRSDPGLRPRRSGRRASSRPQPVSLRVVVDSAPVVAAVWPEPLWSSSSASSSPPWPEPLWSSSSSSSPLPGPLLSVVARRRSRGRCCRLIDDAVLGADVGVVGVVTEADPLADLAVLDLDVHLHALGAGAEVELDLAAGALLDLDRPPAGGVAVTSRRLPPSMA